MAKKKIERKHVGTTISTNEYEHIQRISERDYTNTHSWLRKTIEDALKKESDKKELNSRKTEE